MKKFNISVIGFPEGEKRKNRIESILEKLLANIFLKLIKKMSSYKFRKLYESQAGKTQSKPY